MQAYDSNAPWSAFSILTIVSSGVANLAMAAVTFVSATAGLFVVKQLGFDALIDPLRQAAIGVWLGLGWLGMATTAYAWLGARGWIRMAPGPPPRALARAGYDWRQAVSASVQSAVGEEAVFRLLALPVVWWVTGQPWIAVAVTSVIWAATHAGGVVQPRWVRIAELTTVGILLGVAFLQWGFVTVLVAHLTSNVVLLAWPVLRRRPAPTTSPTAHAPASPS